MIRKLLICALFAMNLSKMNRLSSCICLEIISLCKGAEVVYLESTITLYLILIAIRLPDISDCEFTLFQHSSSHCQNWAMSVSYHRARNSPHKKSFNSCQTLCSNYYEVYTSFFGKLNNSLSG